MFSFSQINKSFNLIIALLLYLCFFVGYLVFVPNAIFVGILQASIAPIAAIIYFFGMKRRRIYFSVFIFLYALADFLTFFYDLFSQRMYFYFSSILFLGAYISLIIEIYIGIQFSVLLKNFKIPTVVLIFLSLFIILTVLNITGYLTSETDLRNMEDPKIYFDFTYYSMLPILLSSALLNFFYFEDNKALYLFLGTFSLIILELITVGYFYIFKERFVVIVSCLLTLCQFYFFLKHVELNRKPKDSFFM